MLSDDRYSYKHFIVHLSAAMDLPDRTEILVHQTAGHMHKHGKFYTGDQIYFNTSNLTSTNFFLLKYRYAKTSRWFCHENCSK